MIVFDTSAIAALVLKNSPLREAARRALSADPEVLVAPVWRSELRSTLRKYHRARELTADDCARAFDLALRKFSRVELEPETRQVLLNAEEFGLSTYDAEHLTVARTVGAMLVTDDGRTLASRAPAHCLSLASFAAKR